MSQTLTTLSFWLHALGTVILIGHYCLLSLVYLPVFEKNQAEPVSRTILSEISKRSRSWLYVSLLIFAVTGIYLTFVDPNYLGIGNFGNPWAILMLVKHILILGMLGMGFWYNGLMRSARAELQRFSPFALRRVQPDGGCRCLVLLLTAIS
jgi:uncharacterized membrane protein